MAEFRVQRVVPRPVDETWTAFTYPDALASWFWPPRLDASIHIDLRVGGGFRVASEPGRMAVTGEYLEVEAPGRLVHTWRWDGEEEQTLVTITFLPVEGGTGLTILHERFADAEVAEQNRLGWQTCLDRLTGDAPAG